MPPPQETEHAVQGLCSHLEKKTSRLKTRLFFILLTSIKSAKKLNLTSMQLYYIIFCFLILTTHLIQTLNYRVVLHYSRLKFMRKMKTQIGQI